MTFDKSYIEVLKKIEKDGVIKSSRPGINTKSIFTTVIEASDSVGWSGIPISRLRKIYYKGAIIETLWLLGLHMKDNRYKNLSLTNTKYLEDYNVKYWRHWQDEDGNLGPVYGEQLVNWYNHNDGSHINQIQNIINTLRVNPDDRRLVASMWNPAEISKMALPPCHHSLWFYSYINEIGERVLNTTWHQRSADMPIGIPYNVLQYTIVNKIVAMCTGHKPGVVRGVLGDAHYYLDQQDAVKEIISRENDIKKLKSPILRLGDNVWDKMYEKNSRLDLEDFAIDGSDFEILDYEFLEHIDIPVAV